MNYVLYFSCYCLHITVPKCIEWMATKLSTTKSLRQKSDAVQRGNVFINQIWIPESFNKMTKKNEPEYGLTGPDCVFNRDQVPVELRCNMIDEKGVSVSTY